MDATQELRLVLEQMDLRPEDLDVEYDEDNECWALIRRHPAYQNADANTQDTIAVFLQPDAEGSPLANWLINQIRQCEKLQPT